MTLTILLIVLGLLIALLGIVGCLLPVIPGPPLSFVALLILSLAKDWEPFSGQFLIITGILAVVVSLVDYVLPAEGARKYGASKLGVTGSAIGMVIGFFFFPPVGIFVGAFLGAVVGELTASKGGKDALRAGWGVFVGIMVGTGIKLAFTGAMLFFYIKALF